MIDHLVGILRIPPAVDLHFFIFQVLVRGEELRDFLQLVRMDLLIAVDVEVPGIRAAHGQNLFVTFAVVDHFHQTDHTHLLQAPWKARLINKHQHIQGIVVVPQRRRQEAVVPRVMHRRVQVAIQLEHVQLLVVLVLHLSFVRNLDDRVHNLRRLGAHRQFQIIRHGAGLVPFRISPA